MGRQLGSQSYGNAVVSGGMVFVGTNNEGLRDPKDNRRQGCADGVSRVGRQLSCGRWSTTSLIAGRVNDWPYQGVASSPLVEGDRVYYVSNRAELMCLDTQGFRDKENDGPVTDEKLTGETNADVVWRFDMMEEVGSLPHNLANSSPVMYGDLILCQHFEWSGRKSRQHSFAKSAGHHRRQQEDRQTSLGRQLCFRPDSARAMGPRRRSALLAAWSRYSRPGRWLGSRLRSSDRQEALGVRHQPERFGLAKDAQ